MPALRRLGLAVAVVFLAACPQPGPAPLTADLPLHLEEHWGSARLEGSAVPADLPAPKIWAFDVEQPAWKAAQPLDPGRAPALVSQQNGALRISLTEAHRARRGLYGGAFVELPGWNREDWASIVVEARASTRDARLTAWFNRRRQAGEMVFDHEPFLLRGEAVDLLAAGATHRYLLRADWTDSVEGSDPWTELALVLTSPAPASVELLSVELVPKEARFAGAPAGVVTEPRDQLHRRTLFTHAPSRLEYRVRLPEGARLDLGLGVLRADAPVTFRVEVGAGRSAPETVFEEACSTTERWAQRSVDLARWAGRTVTLALESRAERRGAVALWAAPTLSGRAAERPPNVVLYVIDAGGAEYASAYGYPRPTTPNLEKLAARGGLFENARSNSSWSKPSTTSFMTSLQHSVLGGYATPSDPLPESAGTMAEILHRAGYQTAVFTSNTWCGTMSSLERGVDELRETVAGPSSASSAALQAEFFRWRDAYPGQPYWVHFQTTDVHWPWEAVEPTAGTFLSTDARERFQEMERKLGGASGGIGRSWALRAPAGLFTRAGVDRRAYFEAARDAYDEAFLHNDHQLGRLVAELGARGEWENTLLVVTADHGDWPGLGLLSGLDPEARVPYLNAYLTRVPLVFTWPGRIRPGSRFEEPVSLLDLLPTVLDLAGQPKPAYLQGQSLAPLLLGKPGWERRPVVIDEFTADPETGRLSGVIEMIDGSWGASLAVGGEGRPEEDLLLFDLASDPYCLKSLQAERPDLAKTFRQRLERQLFEHLALAKKFPRAAAGGIESDQLETLRALGYLE